MIKLKKALDEEIAIRKELEYALMSAQEDLESSKIMDSSASMGSCSSSLSPSKYMNQCYSTFSSFDCVL